jgi:hypothetical protein
VVGGAADDTVYATAATLNAGDSLTGGGWDVLALVGSGSSRIDQLASYFSGFERIRLDNPQPLGRASSSAANRLCRRAGIR